METDSKDYSFSRKWSSEINQYNFTQIPNLLIECQAHMGLTDGETITLIHLLKFWYDHESKVYPSINTLKRYSEKDFSTIQRRLKVLEEKGFLKRIRRSGTSNTYDMKLCARKLHEHQKVCIDPPRKQSGVTVKKQRVDTSFLPTKEYEVRTRQKSKKTENVIFPYFDKYTGRTLR